MICTVERNHNSIKKHSWTKENCSVELQKNGLNLVLVVKRPNFEFALSLEQNLKTFQTKDGGYSFRSIHCDSLIKFQPEKESLGDFMKQIQNHDISTLTEYPNKAKIIRNTANIAKLRYQVGVSTPKRKFLESSATPISYKMNSYPKVNSSLVSFKNNKTDESIYTNNPADQINLHVSARNYKRNNIGTSNLPAKSPLNELYTNNESSEGFRNIGQTCYMAAVLQLLVSSTLKNKIITATSLISNERNTELFMMFADIMQKNSKNERFELGELKALFGNKTEKFGTFEQEDAHEFLISCLDQLSLATIFSKNRLNENVHLNEKGKELSSPILNAQSTLKELDPISEILLIAKHTLKCVCCDFESSHLEFYNDVSLNLPESGIGVNLAENINPLSGGGNLAEYGSLSDKNPDSNLSLEVMDVGKVMGSTGKRPCDSKAAYSNNKEICFAAEPKENLSIEHLLCDFFKPENVEYKCPKCSSILFNLLKTITEAPKTLLLHLKRFSNLAKRADRIEIPKIINLDQLRYKLKGVVSHLGSSMLQGHYIFDLWDGKFWTRFDDSTVTRNLKKLDCGTTSYIVMYEKF